MAPTRTSTRPPTRANQHHTSPGRDLRPLVPVGAAAVLLLLLWLGPVLGAASSVLFWAAAIAVAALVVQEARSIGEGGGDRTTFVAAAATALVVLAVFDPVGADSFNAVKLPFAVAGGFAAAAAAVLAWGRRPDLVRLRTGVELPVGALVVWSLVAAFGAGAPELGILGAERSYDGVLLLAGCALLFLAVSATTRLEQGAALLRSLVLGGGGLVVLYGLLQLHDRTWGGGWDWVEWAEVSFRDTAIWSTFGNPNHLSGFLATLLPIAGVLLLLERRLWARVLLVVVAVASLVEILQTAARGGWLATVVGLVVLGLLLTSELRRRRRVLPFVLGAVAVALAVGIPVAASSTSLRAQISGLTDFGDQSTANERLEYWGTSVEMAMDNPLVGIGPDNFRFAFPSHQSAEYVEAFGPNQFANGPHNMFFNQLATTGWLGLLALLAVVALVVARIVGALRLLGGDGEDEDDRVLRLLLVGSTAALAAFVTQASFNVQQVATTVVFWLLLGVIVGLTVAAGVPVSADPRVVLGRRAAPARAAVRRPRAGAPVPVPAAVGAGLLALVAIGGPWFASGPWRAERAYASAVEDLSDARFHGEIGSDDAEEHARSAAASLEDAIDANPWRAQYRALRGDGFRDLALRSIESGDLGTATRALEQAEADLRRAADLEPDNAGFRGALADVYTRIAAAGRDEAALDDAEDALRAAIERNPWRASFQARLAMLLADRGDTDEAVRLAGEMLDVTQDVEAGREVARHLQATGRDDEADAVWRAVLEINPEDSHAKDALAR